CIAGNASIIKTVNTPLYTQLGSNFDCIYEHLEQAKQEIITWRDDLYLRHPELLYPEFYAYLAENNTTVAELSAQPLTRVLIDVDDASDIGTDIEALFLVKNYVPAGFNLANYVNLKTIAMFDGTMTDVLRTAIQNLAKQQKKLECVNLNTTSIGNSAFELCSSILSVTLPNVTSIPNRAFLNCSTLVRVDCPLVTSVDSEAFKGCKVLNSCNFGLLTSIGSGAFYDAKELVSLSGLINLTSLSNNCFNYCPKLRTVGGILDEMNLNVMSIGSSICDGCSSILKVTLPNITSIPNWAFLNCYTLISVNCPLVTSIGNDAFKGCKVLNSCNFGLLTSIGSGAFSGCTSLNPIPSVIS
ncbi:MAG: leucine-rich repeat domain-containing protein, partial [Holosporales bacterium]|nr:leucine-rich repeat domain-containing protein [Holosporales bacterium]